MTEETYVDITTNGKTALLMGRINEIASSKIVHWIFEQNFKQEHACLCLVINSTGGSLHHAMAIVDAMASSQILIVTRGIGYIASAALLIFVAGQERTLTSNTTIMTHQPWDSVEGQDLAFEAMNCYRKLCKEQLLKHYEACTQLSRESIQKELFPPHDRYLSAQQALSLNLCDTIFDTSFALDKTKHKCN